MAIIDAHRETRRDEKDSEPRNVRTDLHGERVHVGPERDDGPIAAVAGDGGDDAGLGDRPRVGDADGVELCAHELAGEVLLERQLRPLVDAPPHAANPGDRASPRMFSG
nr:unnamed protein product [Digitaria exilis]